MLELFPNIANDIENALTYYSSKQENANDFLVLTTGHEICKKNKPINIHAQRSYYTLHFVHAGKGYISYSDEAGETHEVTVHAKQIFLLYSNVNASYWPDREDPWEYSWVSFCGTAVYDYARRLTDKYSPVIDLRDSKKVEREFIEFRHLDDYPHSKDLRIHSLALQIFAEIINAKPTPVCIDNSKNHIGECLLYIQKHYKEASLSVKEISDSLRLNEKYLSRLFTAQVQIPIFRYIALLRLQKACAMLNDSDLPVKEIALTVGYTDPLYFSKKFTKYVGMSPTEWRNKNKK